MNIKKRRLGYIPGIFLIGAVSIFASPVNAEDSTTVDLSTQPHLKSWSNVIPNASRRFVILADFSNVAVLDRETGLVWERSPSIELFSWDNRGHNCISKTIGGRKGWRLPSVVELGTLVDPNVAFPGPTLPAGHPFTNILSTFYWSSTKDAHDPTAAWGFDYQGGDSDTKALLDSFPAWCVRGPMNADQY